MITTDRADETFTVERIYREEKRREQTNLGVDVVGRGHEVSNSCSG